MKTFLLCMQEKHCEVLSRQHIIYRVTLLLADLGMVDGNFSLIYFVCLLLSGQMEILPNRLIERGKVT